MPFPVSPRPLFLFLRLLPLDEQETSYFAASARIFNFSRILSDIPKNTKKISIATQHSKDFFDKKIGSEPGAHIAALGASSYSWPVRSFNDLFFIETIPIFWGEPYRCFCSN